MRKYIALIDCDSFFASVEQKDNPSLKNKAVCVLSQVNDRGIVLARSKLTKKMGIKMCDPYFKIKHNFPDVVFLPARHHRYQEVSHQIMSLIQSYAPDTEISSIDEAFIDLTGLDKIYKKTPFEMITDIRNKIKNKLDMPVSIGLAPTKTLAKLASELAKENKGLYEITSFAQIAMRSIDEVTGIGKMHNKRLAMHGIFTIKDFAKTPDAYLKKIMGISASHIKSELLGKAIAPVDNSPTIPKSIQSSQAFQEFTSDKLFLIQQLNFHIQQACRKLRANNALAGTAGIMLKYKNFQSVILHEKLPTHTDNNQDIHHVLLPLFEKMYQQNTLYRSCGISLENIINSTEKQADLFAPACQKTDKLNQTIDALESKFGQNIIKKGWM